MTLALPRFRRDQWEIASHPARVKVVACGRRWGKTTLDYATSLAVAAHGGKAAYVVPFYKNGRSLWRQCEKSLAGLVRQKLVEVNRSERTVAFKNGGFFGVYSAENQDAIRGEAFHLVVVDEAPYVSESAWTDAIMPTLADFGGTAILTGTPRGQNWFFREFEIGRSRMNAEQASWNAPSSANPNPRIKQAFETARLRISERSFRQEWLAEFVTDGGEVFPGVDAASTAEQGEPIPGRMYIGGLDWGQEADYTVLSIFDVVSRAQVALYRFNGIPWTAQRARIGEYCQQWKVATLRPEQNSIGGPNIEALEAEFERNGIHTSVSPFMTTNRSKADAVEALALAIENGHITLLDDDIQKSELKAYARARTLSGAMTYNAPSGMHDDTVMAAVIAWSEVSSYDPEGGVH